MKSLLVLLLLSCWCARLRAAEEAHGEEEGASESGAPSLTGCGVPHKQLYALFGALLGEELTLYVNCLSFDKSGALDTGVISGVNETDGVRLNLGCVEGVITTSPSTEPPLSQNMTASSCTSCDDSAAGLSVCVEGKR